MIQIEELLEERELGGIDEAAFISRGYGVLVKLYDLGFIKDEVITRFLSGTFSTCIVMNLNLIYLQIWWISLWDIVLHVIEYEIAMGSLTG